MSILQSLLESEETQMFLAKNENVITEMSNDVQNFGEIIKEYVFQNPDEFLGGTLEETFKNIRIFTEAATAQYITEIVNTEGATIVENAYSPAAGALDDYL